MPQPVQRDARQGGRPQVALEGLAHAMRIEWLTILRGEDVTGLFPGMAGALLIGLSGGMSLECLNGEWVEGNASTTTGALRLADLHLATERNQGPADGDRVGLQVEVVPPE